MRNKNLRKVLNILIIVILVLAIFTIVKADSGCLSSDTVCFEKESNSEFIGSYVIYSPNGAILERDEWENVFELIWSNPGCIVVFSSNQTMFYADWDSWYWKTKTNLFGETCYKLVHN